MDFGFLLTWTIFIPFLIGIFYYKNIKSFKWLFFFISYGVFNEILSLILIKSGANNTLPNSHIYAYVSFILMCSFYNSILDGFINRKWFYVSVVLFTMFYLINLIFLQSIYEYPDLPFSVSSIIIIAYTILYFFKTMVETKIENITGEPLIWINVGILIYFTGNLFYHILFNFLLESSRDFLLQISFYFRVLIALFYILIAIGFLKTRIQQRQMLD